ncbi:MAG: choice-of-anchor J domain-containing protein [Bacteroidales bacterium]|nr:hypothetical protein [Bacteroidales bacterium]
MMRKFTQLVMLWLFATLIGMSGFAQTTVTIGTGTLIDRYPLEDHWIYQRSQMLFLSGEIGMGGRITKIRWYRDDAGPNTGGDIEIWLKETTATSIVGSVWESPGTLVFSTTDIDLGSGGAWLEIDISDFDYGGSDNLLVSTYVQDAEYAAPHSNWRYTPTSTLMMRRGQDDNDNPPGLGTSYNRPNIQFDLDLDFSTIILEEGFENGGAIPASWTQEYVIGTNNWRFQNGGAGGNPAAAHSGSYNAALTHTTVGNVTKLVSPALDLSDFASPELNFWHTQAVWSGDQDELRVYYKTSLGGTWTMIPNAEWTRIKLIGQKKHLLCQTQAMIIISHLKEQMSGVVVFV